MARRRRPADKSIAMRLVRAQVIALVVLAIGGLAALWLEARAVVSKEAGHTGVIVARTVAEDPFVLTHLRDARPTTALQPYAMRRMHETGVDFVTIMTTDRVRYTHPDTTQIGQKFPGTITPALHGGVVTETFTGPSGSSVRAVVPVQNADGHVVALVCAGVTTKNVMHTVWARAPWFTAGIALFLAAGIGATLVFGHHLRRSTRGLGPERLAHMYTYYQSVLHAVREGLLVLNGERDLVLCNDHGAQLLGIDPAVVPIAVCRLELPPALSKALADGSPVSDELFLTADRVLVVNQQETADGGTVVTLRDHTELERLTSQVQSMRTLSDALRSQNHEHANRLHTIVTLIENGHPGAARDFAALDVSDGQALVDAVVQGGDAVLASLLVGKSAQADERGIEFHAETSPRVAEERIDPRDIVTVVGNLLDNAMDAATGDPPWVAVYVDVDDGPDPGIVVQVTDSGPGVRDPAQAIQQGYSTKDGGPYGRGYGLALVHQAAQRRGGTLDFHREPHSTVTVTLPRLPEEGQ